MTKEIDRELPQSIQTEESVLGSMISVPEYLDESMPELSENYFYSDISREIFLSIQKLYLSHSPVDLLTITNELKSRSKFDFIGGQQKILSITDNVMYKNPVHHISILKELYLKRELVKLGSNCIDMGYNKAQVAEESIHNVDLEVSRMNEINIGVDYESNISEEIAQRFIENTTPRENNITGIPTGNGSLTNITNGWQKGDLIVLSARASMGKTARGIDFTLHAAANRYKVAFFTMEMKKKDVQDRMLLNVSEITSDVIKYQKWDDVLLKKYEEAATWIAKSNIYINDKSSATPNYIRSVCRQRKRKHGLDMIVIDYIQYMDSDKKLYNRQEEVASISRSLKKIAKELNVPVIALCQISRDVEKRSDRRPMLSDLKESGAIEQDADVVIALYRPSYYTFEKNEDKDYKNEQISDEEYRMIVETIVLKHRNGSTGKIKEYFNVRNSRFYESSPIIKEQEKLPF